MKHFNEGLIAALDIGSGFVRMAAGQVSEKSAQHNGGLQILGASEYASEGVCRGKINSIEDAVSSVSACLENVERVVGVPIEKVWVGVSGTYINIQSGKGVVSVSKSNNEIGVNEIGEEDVVRALETSQSVSTPLNYDILHVLPKGYSIDGQSGIKDPIGMTGMRLEVDTNIVLGLSSQLKNLSTTVYRTGLSVEDMILSILGTAESVTTKKQREIGVAVVNLGASTTTIAVYEEGELLHVAVIPLGSENITNDIALLLKTSVELAEMVKIKYGDCRLDQINRRDQVDLFDFGTENHELYKKYYINEIISARVEEILAKVDEELNKIQRSGLLPAGAVFVGGGAKLPGLVEAAKKLLNLPAFLGYPLDLISATDKAYDLGFAPVVGMVKWIASEQHGGGHRRFEGVKRASDFLKKIFKSIMP